MSLLTIEALDLDKTTPLDDDEFTLDMRVVESTTPLATMMCDTGDGCGDTCNGSACTTSSNDPS
ncbi:FxLD family lanthipeptide [Streptosporangium subroseum]|uniref:FxLD family lanthipeptide n=1 Tax=Streptosporangium subroseum TaxID=106412 RepID=UPI00308931A9|nr:FxLD family lanthipeptide [Streptosporangium subroseum]